MIELKLTPSQPLGLSTMSMAFSILTAADREPARKLERRRFLACVLRLIYEADPAAAFFI
ncbi:hypothetical protein MOB49_01290 [Bacillus haynesii]|uniref:hypothetical protein n=1 Tax=Bacillus haynesii TaxID=1925021 RepID=UPI0015F44BB7|nr:hypothetical protein [Bacillus haynesii]MBU8681784.1 hypothetical protein [Bacillus haynesii]MCY7965710.1 hypothetical protein [Bacillus haynesii]MCY7993690.1 hypothetical protein [Bacillus haynesii]MCY8092171.1 hypothetical protein [Bacillus haynesii]MCY8216021.1 hypothetical protein [Bacillus haynesii]